MAEYTSISLPTDLIDKIKQSIKDKSELGYTTVPEFIKDAIRRHFEHIDHIEKLQKEYEIREENMRKILEKELGPST